MDDGQRIGIYITFFAAAGKIDALEAAVRRMIPVAANESGTLFYAVHRLAGERPAISVYELYSDRAALAAHGNSAALAALRAELPGLIAEPPQRYELKLIAESKGTADR